MNAMPSGFGNGAKTLEHMSSPERTIDAEITEEAIRALVEKHLIVEQVIKQERLDAAAAGDTVEPQHVTERAESDRSDSGAKPGGDTRKGRKFGLPKYRPTRKHICLALVAVIIVARPWLIPLTVLLVTLSAVIAYLSLGHDRVCELIARGYAMLERRRPAAAKMLRQRTANWIERTTVKLDRLPGNWSDVLYFPGLKEQTDTPEKMHQDPFERLQGGNFAR